MANPLKKLAGQTAIYGLTSIVGRLLNYLLVPLHTAIFVPEQFGIITEMYSYVAFLIVLLTFGMETAFFRFSTKSQGANQKNVYTTVILSIAAFNVVFIALALLFDQAVANALQYPDNSEYVIWFALIVGLDALGAIPLARLRMENKAKHFALVNIANILVNIGLNLFFIGYLMPAGAAGESNFLVDNFYHVDIGVGYVFIANLIASVVKFALLLPVVFRERGSYEFKLLRQLLIYGSPLLLSNIFIVINETLDKPLLKWMLNENGDTYAQAQVGIYGACYKISILMHMFIQAFRYAADPFYFNESERPNAKKTYAQVMLYFVLICLVISMGVVFYMDLLKYFISDQQYWVGLMVVPILLLANMCYGLYYNLAVWYKVTDKTSYSILIAGVGGFLTIVLNIWWIPLWGYMGSAWATLAAYGSMVLISYFLGRKHYPVPYKLMRIAIYATVAIGLLFILNPIPDIVEAAKLQSDPGINWLKIGVNTLVLLAFVTVVYLIERPKKSVT